MIKHLLQVRYPSEYGLTSKEVNVSLTEHTTLFSLSDSKACISCRAARDERQDCNEEVLRINPNGNIIQVINFEAYIQQFAKVMPEQKDRCDYLLYSETKDERKIAFCDLTCSDIKWVEPNKGKYPEGKKAKARQQMNRSIEYLVTEPLFGEFIYTCSKRMCIFGWRDYNFPQEEVKSLKKNFRANLQTFMTTPSAMAKRLTTEVMFKDSSFEWITIKYPEVYQW